MRKSKGCQTLSKHTTNESGGVGNVPESTVPIIEICANKNETKIGR